MISRLSAPQLLNFLTPRRILTDTGNAISTVTNAHVDCTDLHTLPHLQTYYSATYIDRYRKCRLHRYKRPCGLHGFAYTTSSPKIQEVPSPPLQTPMWIARLCIHYLISEHTGSDVSTVTNAHVDCTALHTLPHLRTYYSATYLRCAPIVH
ncbi:hypothetical protein J6590_053374 [Homalodisca vitripennis]|nr:hypothetical protein J6590_053374 [Homalodisca vitripennis]